MTDALRPAADFLSRRSVPDPQAPTVRPRRLRTTPAMRRLAREHVVDPAALILPVFVREDIDTPHPVEAMPGVVQHTLDSLRREAAACAEAGIGAIDLFGVPAERDASGTSAWAEDGILNRGIAAVRAEVGDDVVVCADTCLDEFTSHGHCGLIRPDGPRAGEVDNDATLATYQAMAISQAEAGAHMVSPSGMMDGQVAAIRAALDATGHDDVAILAYSAKYASAYFGPFREAVGSTLTGDRRAYQQDPANRREGLREAMLDVEQGADMVMVKPAGPYLDVLADVAAASPVPVAAYQVSGEYAMVEAAAANGWIDRDRVMRESVLGIVRAGADCVLTYWARELAEERRLAYVGITRAQRRLYVSRALMRASWGNPVTNPPSRFLQEIPGDLVDWRREEPQAQSWNEWDDWGESSYQASSRPWQPPAAPSPQRGGGRNKELKLAVGDRVNHEKYGLSTVLEVNGTGVRATVVIDFGSSGTVRLMLIGGLPMEKL